jgi:hypothetical protein
MAARGQKMRALSIQVQPDLSPGIDMSQVTAAFELIAGDSELVKHHSFDHGYDKAPYFNYTFGTPDAGRLWQIVRKNLYSSRELTPHMRRASMAVCSSEEGWDEYLLLYHFDPAVKLDAATAL